MPVTDVRYTTPEQVPVNVEYDDQTEVSMASYPSGTWRDADVAEWLDAGNSIQPYDPYYGQTDEQIRQQRYADNKAHAEDLIRAAQSNPVQGVNLDNRETEKEAKKRDNRGNGKDKVTDQDDALVDHIDDVYDAQDLADDQVEAMNNREDIINWTPDLQSWPVWSPPA